MYENSSSAVKFKLKFFIFYSLILDTALWAKVLANKHESKGRGQLKKTFSFGHCPNKGGGLPMPEFFGPLFRSAFLVNKKSLFLQKCQCIELLTVF